MQLKTQRGKTCCVWCNQWAVFNHHRACSVSSGWWIWGWKQNRQVQMIRCISTAENTVQLRNVELHAKSARPLAAVPLKQPALIKGPIIPSSLRSVNELVWCFQTGNSFPLLHTDTHNTLCSLTTQTETCFSSEMTKNVRRALERRNVSGWNIAETKKLYMTPENSQLKWSFPKVCFWTRRDGIN